MVPTCNECGEVIHDPDCGFEVCDGCLIRIYKKSKEMKSLLDKALNDIKFVKGIVERGTGKPIPKGTVIVKALLDYVKQLESRG